MKNILSRFNSLQIEEHGSLSDLTLRVPKTMALLFYLNVVNIVVINFLHQKEPSKPEYRLFSFLKPLALEIWFYSLCAYVLVSLTICIVARFSPGEWREPELCEECELKKMALIYGEDFHYCDESSSAASSGIGSGPQSRRESQIVADDEIEFVDDPCTAHEHDDEMAALEYRQNEYTLLNSFWFTIGSLMQQGSDLNPKVPRLLRLDLIAIL